MEKKHCSYELSKLAKEAGFDEECENGYEFLNCITFGTFKSLPCKNSQLQEKICTAPELPHLQQWVYEKFGIWITSNDNLWIKEQQYSSGFLSVFFDCPYKALECGLLEFLKSKQNEK